MNRRFRWPSTAHASRTFRQPVETPDTSDHAPTMGDDEKEINPNRRTSPLPMERVDAELPKHALLRFFDFSVETGTMYRYRVSLALRNPNYKVVEKYLKDPVYAKENMLRTAWSEASNVVLVPEDVRVLAGDVTTPHAGAGEPEAKVTIMKWLKDSGITANHEFSKLVRGTLLDFYHVKTIRPASAPPGSSDIGRMAAGLRHAHPTPSPAARGDALFVDYTTGAALVDIASDGAAGRLLLVDSLGNLTAHNDIEDKWELQSWKESQESRETPGAGPGMGPRPMGPRPGDADIFGFGGHRGPGRKQ